MSVYLTWAKPFESRAIWLLENVYEFLIVATGVTAMGILSYEGNLEV